MTSTFQSSGFKAPKSIRISRREIKYNTYSYPNATILSPTSFPMFDINPPDLVVKIHENGLVYAIPLNLKFVCDNVPYFESMLREGNNFREKCPKQTSSYSITSESVPSCSKTIPAKTDVEIKFSEKNKPAEVELKNFQAKTVQKYFNCLYEKTGVEITTDEAFNLYDLADYFQDTETRSQCVIHIKSTLEQKHLMRAVEYSEFDLECASISRKHTKASFQADFENNLMNLSEFGLTKLVSICDVEGKLTCPLIENWIRSNMRFGAENEINNERVFEFLKGLDMGKFSQGTIFNLTAKVFSKYLQGEKLREIIDSLPMADEDAVLKKTSETENKTCFSSAAAGLKFKTKKYGVIKPNATVSNDHKQNTWKKYEGSMERIIKNLPAFKYWYQLGATGKKIRNQLKKELIKEARENEDDIDEILITQDMIDTKAKQIWESMSDSEHDVYSIYTSDDEDSVATLDHNRKRPAPSTFGNLSKSTGFASPSTSFTSTIKSPTSSVFNAKPDIQLDSKVNAIFGGKKVLKEGDTYHADKKMIMDRNREAHRLTREKQEKTRLEETINARNRRINRRPIVPAGYGHPIPRKKNEHAFSFERIQIRMKIG